MSELEVELIPILDDNYVFLIWNKTSLKAALVDPGEADACLKSLKKRGLSLDFILITHHHADHIDGIAELKLHFPKVQVYAPLKNKIQIPRADHYLSETDSLNLAGLGQFKVLEMPGHTLGHIAYFKPEQNWLFSGDVLFGLGCGRLFEGTPEMAFETLQRIKDLPSDTQIFCTHELTQINLKFVQELIESKTIFESAYFEKYKQNLGIKRSHNLPSVPLLLRDELHCNPFLLAQQPQDFARLRQLRNDFKPNKSI